MPLPQKHSHWSKKLVAENNRLYGLWQVLEDGRRAWYYILIDPVKESRFLRAMKNKETFTLTEYGEIVDSGFGYPSESVKQRMRDEYKANIEE